MSALIFLQGRLGGQNCRLAQLSAMEKTRAESGAGTEYLVGSHYAVNRCLPPDTLPWVSARGSSFVHILMLWAHNKYSAVWEFTLDTDIGEIGDGPYHSIFRPM